MTLRSASSKTSKGILGSSHGGNRAKRTPKRDKMLCTASIPIRIIIASDHRGVDVRCPSHSIASVSSPAGYAHMVLTECGGIAREQLCWRIHYTPFAIQITHE